MLPVRSFLRAASCLLLLVAGRCSSRSHACTCSWPPIDVRLFNEQSALFLGTVIRQGGERSDITYTFRVSRWYKGSNGTDTINVTGPWDDAACGFGRLNDTSTYLMIAYAAADTLWTYRCLSPIHPQTKLPFDYRKDTALLAGLVRRAGSPGRQTFHDPAGRMLATGQYRNGHPYGRWQYYEDGRLSLTGRYSATGLRDSIWTSYKKTGGIDRQHGYADGQQTPWERSFSDNKKLDSECYPVPGTDLWETKLYYWSGRLRVKMTQGPQRKGKRGSMQDGLLNGPREEYYESGVVKERGTYYKGLPTGPQRFYDEHGKLVRTETGKSKEAIDAGKE